MSILKSEQITKTFSNGVKAVKDLSIDIIEGEVFGFLGPNGAGKSTSIHMMTGLISPTSGKLEVLGHSLPSNSRELTNEIGYVPQNLIFYKHLTVKENLELFASCYEIRNPNEAINETMEVFEIRELKNQKAGEMSGGQKRRLNVAIGLLHTPKLLFLDEPSAGMDPHSRNNLWNNIEKLSNDLEITIILTTHLMETAERLSDRIAIIDHGIIQVVDTPANLKKKYGYGDTVEIKFKENLSMEKFNKINQVLKSNIGEDKVLTLDNCIKVSNGEGVETIVKCSNLLDRIVDKSEIKEISMHDSTIEDVFLKVTGHELRE